MKHYEDVWVEAEKISSDFYIGEEGVEQAASEIKSDARNIQYCIEEFGGKPQIADMTSLVGDILFHIARICKEFNINSWTALEEAINNTKIDLYEEDKL